MTQSGPRARLAAMVAALLLSTAALASPAALDAKPAIDEPTRVRMTDYLVDMMPLHRIFAQLIDANGAELEQQLQPGQASCFRQQVARPAFVQRKRKQVDVFASEDPDNFRASMDVLDNGAGELMKRLGAQSIQASLATDGDAVAVAEAVAPEFDPATAPPDQLVAFTTFAYGSAYERLRRLSGYGEFVTTGDDVPMPFEAMFAEMAEEISNTCGIPAEFFE